MANKAKRCECADHQCPVHQGKDCTVVPAICTLRRVDMDDATGTRFCGKCADDALESGLFA